MALPASFLPAAVGTGRDLPLALDGFVARCARSPGTCGAGIGKVVEIIMKARFSTGFRLEYCVESRIFRVTIPQALLLGNWPV